VQASPLFENEKVKRAVLAEGIPKTLQAQLGMDAILNRVPQSYLRAIFGMSLLVYFVCFMIIFFAARSLFASDFTLAAYLPACALCMCSLD
jgi:hypothetical protein